MGGGGQANSGQASQAAAQQTAANTQDMALSAQNMAYQKQLMGTLFGTGQGTNQGSVGAMLDPSKLDSANLTGAYKSAYNQGTNQLSQDYANQKGQLAQGWANAGMGSGSTPSGFQADQQRQLGSSEADSRGQAFSSAIGAQHNEALNNFWNAANVANGQAASTGTGATTGAANSGSSSAAVYGTAGAYHPPATTTALIGAGGQIGGGAASHCPCEGSKILMADGSEKLVEKLAPGDKLLGIDGDICTVDTAKPYFETCLSIRTEDGCLMTSSASHALIAPGGGFVIAFESLGRTIRTVRGKSKIALVQLVGKQRIFDILTNGSHSYRAGGMWGWGVGDIPSDSYLALKETQERLAKVWE